MIFKNHTLKMIVRIFLRLEVQMLLGMLVGLLDILLLVFQFWRLQQLLDIL